MDQRLFFVRQVAQSALSMSELCRVFGVSRKTGYKWLRRFKADPTAPLTDRSHAPLNPAHGIAPETVDAILAMKATHPTWGPRKIVAALGRQGSLVTLPAPSTAGRLLSCFGLVRPRRRRQRNFRPGSTTRLTEATAPNVVWCIDFKGQFELLRGPTCYPLTLEDAYSRFFLTCRAFTGTKADPVLKACERAFREYGLPDVLRHDGGGPWVTTTLSGLSKLAVYWIRLGIRLERIAPARPDQNGRLERLHRTLKQDVLCPPQATMSAQQSAFDAFRRIYNDERPHESLGNQTPASVYSPSQRQYPRQLPDLVYPDHYYLRRLDDTGQLRWLSHRIYLSNCLAYQVVGLAERSDGTWSVYFGSLELGVVTRDGTLMTVDAYRRSQRRRGSDAIIFP